jgi:cholesterol transport system auxiliary component
MLVPRSIISVLRAILLSLAVVAIPGCTLQNNDPPPTTYVLNANIDPPVTGPGSRKILLVATPRTESGFDTTRIAYTRTPLTLEYYSQSQWADTPARMLVPLLVQALESAGAFGAVLTPPSAAAVDLQLDITLIRLQQEFLQTPSQIRLTLRATLTDLKRNRVLAGRLFEAIEAAPQEDAYGGVRAADKAVTQLLTQITRFVIANI